MDVYSFNVQTAKSEVVAKNGDDSAALECFEI